METSPFHMDDEEEKMHIVPSQHDPAAAYNFNFAAAEFVAPTVAFSPRRNTISSSTSPFSTSPSSCSEGEDPYASSPPPCFHSLTDDRTFPSSFSPSLLRNYSSLRIGDCSNHSATQATCCSPFNADAAATAPKSRLEQEGEELRHRTPTARLKRDRSSSNMVCGVELKTPSPKQRLRGRSRSKTLTPPKGTLSKSIVMMTARRQLFPVGDKDALGKSLDQALDELIKSKAQQWSLDFENKEQELPEGIYPVVVEAPSSSSSFARGHGEEQQQGMTTTTILAEEERLLAWQQQQHQPHPQRPPMLEIPATSSATSSNSPPLLRAAEGTP
ncbi:hypothetical protein QOT17_014384 [Balamuthia mandrillaris]